MDKKVIYRTDWCLVWNFPFTLVTGLVIHGLGHTGDLQTMRGWMLIHILGGILFAVFSILHIVAHWKWYRSLKKNFFRQSKVTLGLSVLYLVTMLTGFFLVYQKGGDGTHLSLLHYQAGIVMGVLGIWHLLHRVKILLKRR